MLANTALKVPLLPALLTPEYYSDQAQPVSTGGRQAAWYVEQVFGAGVLRQYRRGGWVAWISRQHYFWQGETKTRCFQEYRLLEKMKNQGLLVPTPLAAAYWRTGPTYRAALLMQRLPHVQPLTQCVKQPIWETVAQAIVQLHRAHIWHADLNAYNILIDNQQQTWIIDFDRAQQKHLSKRDRENNLKRLKRSLEKTTGVIGALFWIRLKQAYESIWQASPSRSL